MYVPIDRMREIAERADERPLMWCEYAHSMGNSTGHLAAYAKFMREYDNVMGGFIWDWRDQGLRAVDTTTQRSFFAYGGDRGERYHDGNFLANGLVFADAVPQPAMYEVREVFAPVVVEQVAAPDQARPAGRYEVANRYDFKSLAGHRVVYRVEVGGAEAIAEGTLELADVPPGSSVALDLPARLATGREGGDDVVLHVAVYAEPGSVRADYPISERSFVLARAQAVNFTAGATPEVEESRGALRFRSGEVALTIGRDGITEIDLGGGNLLRGPVVPTVYRAPTDNDRAWGLPRQYAAHAAAQRGLDSAAAQFLSVERDSAAGAVLRYDLPGVGVVTVPVRLRDEALELGVSLAVADSSAPPVRLGLALPLARSSERESVTFAGLGPHENYVDRRDGARYGVYTVPVEQLQTPYINPGEHGTRTGVTRLGFDDFQVFGREFAFSIHPYAMRALIAADHTVDLPVTGPMTLYLDAGMEGVGGDDSWSQNARAWREHRLSGNERATFTLAPR